MKIIAIDNILCIKCRDCVEECPENLFYSPPTKIGEKRKVFFEDQDLLSCDPDELRKIRINKTGSSTPSSYSYNIQDLQRDSG